MKRPNSKLQAPEKFQATSSNFSARRFGHWCLVFLWSLELGAWNLDAIAQPLSNLVFTVGTTIQDASLNNWSYVLLGAPASTSAWTAPPASGSTSTTPPGAAAHLPRQMRPLGSCLELL